MSLFKKYLSELKPGDTVKIVQANGQTIEGTILDNDGEEALSLQISATAMIRYQAVDSVSVIGSNNNPFLVPDVAKTEVSQSGQNSSALINVKDKNVNPERKSWETTDQEEIVVVTKPLLSKDRLYDRELNDDTVEEFFKELDTNDQNLFKSSFDSFLANYQNDNEDAAVNDANNLLKLAESTSVFDHKKTLRLAAGACYVANDYENSVMSFYYGSYYPEAYISAFNAAYRLNEDMHFYSLAGALSVLYLLSKQKEGSIVEAASCLKEVCIKCKDVSGVELLLQNRETIYHYDYVCEIIKKICEKLKISFSDDMESNINKIKDKYAQSEIYDLIIKLEKARIEYEERLRNAETDNSKSEEIDTEGNITKLNFFEDKGKITGKSGNIYEFEFADIAESGFQREVKNTAGKGKKDVLIPVSFEVDSTYKNPIAVKIQKRVTSLVTQQPVQIKQPRTQESESVNASYDPNQLFTDQRYEEALDLFRAQLRSGDIENGVNGVLKCLITLYNKKYPRIAIAS